MIAILQCRCVSSIVLVCRASGPPTHPSSQYPLTYSTRQAPQNVMLVEAAAWIESSSPALCYQIKATRWNQSSLMQFSPHDPRKPLLLSAIRCDSCVSTFLARQSAIMSAERPVESTQAFEVSPSRLWYEKERMPRTESGCKRKHIKWA